MQNINIDILIIGGGPSGANAARYLTLGGANVILIEKNFNFDKPCGGGLFVQAFDEFDIPKSLIKKYVNFIDIVSSKKDKIAVDISKFPLGIVHRKEFDSTLRDMAKDAGAKVIEAKMNKISAYNDSVIAEATRKDGGKIRIKANYVIAADGVNSKTRQLILKEKPNSILTYYADIANRDINSCQFWFGDDISPKYYAWIFPHYKGINIGLVANKKKEVKNFYTNFLTKANIAENPKPKGYFIPDWKPMKLYSNRVLFVASLVMPFTYEGIYYALKSGKLAAEALLKNNPKLYEESWNNLYLKRFKFFKLLQKIFLHNDFFSNKMCQLYKHKKFQNAVLGYWRGTKKTSNFLGTIYKVIKILFASK